MEAENFFWGGERLCAVMVTPYPRGNGCVVPVFTTLDLMLISQQLVSLF